MTDTLKDRARALRLYGLIAHWDDIGECSWLPTLIAWEEEERRSRSLKRRLSEARIGRFKPLVDFDWDWPRRCDQMVIEDLMSLEFLREAANVVLVGPNGVGKSTIAANLAHRAIIEGNTVRFTAAGNMLGELAALDSDSLLQRKLRFYARQQLLVTVHRIAGIDDVQGDGGGRGRKGAAEEIDQRRRHPRHLDAGRCVLQAAHGRLRTEVSAAFRPVARRQLDGVDAPTRRHRNVPK